VWKMFGALVVAVLTMSTTATARAQTESDYVLVAGHQSFFAMCWEGAEGQEIRLEIKAGNGPWRRLASTQLIPSTRCPAGYFIAVYVFTAPQPGMYKSRETWPRAGKHVAGRSRGPVFNVVASAPVAIPPPTPTTTRPVQKITWYCPDGSPGVSVPIDRPDLLERVQTSCYDRMRRARETARLADCNPMLPGLCSPGLAPRVP
jgi:hypothetical protein